MFKFVFLKINSTVLDKKVTSLSVYFFIVMSETEPDTSFDKRNLKEPRKIELFEFYFEMISNNIFFERIMTLERKKYVDVIWCLSFFHILIRPPENGLASSRILETSFCLVKINASRKMLL